MYIIKCKTDFQFINRFGDLERPTHIRRTRLKLVAKLFVIWYQLFYDYVTLEEE